MDHWWTRPSFWHGKKSDNRHYGVNRDVRPSKPVFTTLNEQPDTTGKLFHFVAKDVLTRFDLRVENLRAQTYDGAAMSGEYNGCQKLIGDDQPMTYFTTTAQPTAQTLLLIHMTVANYCVIHCCKFRNSARFIHDRWKSAKYMVVPNWNLSLTDTFT